jgi:lysophospholipase L1-like esterase
VLFTTFTPQITLLPQDADLVSITASGNDLGYLGSAIRLGVYFTADRFAGGRLRRRRPAPLPTATPQQLTAATAGLTRVATEVSRRAPQARVILVDYLPMVSAATVPFGDVPFDAATIHALAVLHEQLTEVFAEAARRAQVDLIEASKLGSGHELGTAEPWISPLQPPHRLISSFHPTVDGMRAVGDAISRHIGV